MPFRDLPIKRKLTVAVLGTTLVTLLAACAAFLAYERVTFRRLMARNLNVLVDALASNSTAALAFNTPSDAQETLQALSVKPSVETACLYDADGARFATYSRAGSETAIPAKPEPDGTRFASDHLAVVRPVMLNGKRLGTLCVRNDFSDINDRLRSYAQISGLILLGSLGLAFVLSSALQRAITRPIFALTDTAENIARTHDYTARAKKLSADEIGTLTDGFNEMLAGIQERDHALQSANEALHAENDQRKRVEEDLRVSEERTRLIVETALDAVVTMDSTGVITGWNPQAETIFGWTRDQAVGRSLAETIVPERHREAHGRGVRRYLETGEAVVLNKRIEITALHRDGSEFPIELAITPIRLGGTVVFSAFVRDITKRKHAEEEIQRLTADLEKRVLERTAQLESAVKELDAFSYSVSHDLRAPLRAVDGYSRMVVEDCAAQLDEDGRRMLGVIRSETQRMGQLIDDLLAFSRLGRQQIEPVQIDMRELAQEVFDEQAALEPARKLHLDLHPLPPARGAEAMIRQVWVNLIGNAIKFTKEREVGGIEIGAQAGGDGVPVYFVKDNGAGFDMRFAGKLFGVFQRLHSEKEFHGTGVGLALVQRIVQRHGGRVWAEAEVGRGATFYFALQTQKT